MKHFIYTTLVLVGLFTQSAFSVQAAVGSTFTASFTTTGVTDAIAPSTPSSVVATPVSQSQINLSWTASTDNVGVNGYVVYRDSSAIATTSSTSFADAGLFASTTYTYAIQAFDASFNYSSSSAAVATTTLPVPVVVTATSTPPTSPVVSSGATGSSFIFGLQVAVQSNQALISFNTAGPARSTISWGTTSDLEAGSITSILYDTTHAVTISNLIPNTHYYARVTVIDARGNQFAYPLEFVTPTLVQSPLVNPSNFAAEFATIGRDGVNLSWANPVDPRFDAVRIVRSENFFPRDQFDGVLVYEGARESFFDATAVAGKMYYYAIFAKDANGAYSSGALAQASSVTGTNPFVTAPQAGYVDPLIARLTIADFEFIQQGKDLIITSTSTIMINGMSNLTIRLPYNKVPEVLKTIAVSLTDPKNPSKAFIFLLRANADKTYYEASIGALGTVGSFPLAISILDYQNQSLKQIAGSIQALVNAAPASSKDTMQLLLVIILIAAIVSVIYMARGRRMAATNKMTGAALALAFMFGSCGMLFVPQAHAAINQQINYQGKLTNASNIAVADGSYTASFSLYTTATGGSPIWTELDNGSNKIVVKNGLFSVMLGSTTPFTGVDFNQTLYLGVTIESDSEMTPRKVIGTVPSAIVAQTLQNITPGQFFRNDIQNSTSTSSTFLNVLQSGAGKIAEFFGQSGLSVLSILSNGNVGVGTTTPGSRFAITGSGTGTGKSFIFTNSSNVEKFSINDSGTVLIPSGGKLGLNSIVGQNGNSDGTSGSLSITLNNASFTLGNIGSGNYNGFSTWDFSPSTNTDRPTILRNTRVSDSASAIGFVLQTPNALTNSLATLLNVDSGTNTYFTIKGSGNVGIGTTSPFAKLSVAGDAFIGGNLTATGTLTIASLNGPLQANNGVVSATSSVGVLYGGTGLTTAPSYGNILVGNNAGGYTLTATSSLGLLGTSVASSTYVPYTGASTALDLGAHNLTAAYGNFGSNAITIGYYSGTAAYINTDGSAMFANGNVNIDAAGNTYTLAKMGVGTNAPLYALDIVDSNATGYDIGNSATGNWNIDSGGVATLSGLVVGGNAHFTNTISDGSNSVGTNGMILKSTGSATAWVATSSLGFSAYPFTSLTNFGSTNQATTGIAWFQNGVNASSTSNFVTLNVYGRGLFGDVRLNSSNTTIDTQSGNRIIVGAGQGAIIGSGSGVVSFNSTASTTFSNPITSASGNLIIGSSGTTNNIILNPYGGNVGIGTTSPYSMLSVAGTVVGQNFVGTLTSVSTFGGNVVSAGSIGFGGNFTFTQNSSIQSQIGSNAGGAAGAIAFDYNNTPYYGVQGPWVLASHFNSQGTVSLSSGSGDVNLGGNSNIYMTVKSTGNVGIGTTSPFAKLSVAGDAFIGGNLTATGTINFSGISSGSLAVGSNGNLYSYSTSTWTFASSTLLADNNTFSGKNTFSGATTTFANGISVAGSNGLTVLGNGNVGIGGTNPGHKLDVTGDINVVSGGSSRYLYDNQPVITAMTSLSNYFFGNSGNLTMTGTFNTASGIGALSSNTTGAGNTADGANALNANTTGYNNTVAGAGALALNSSGTNNTVNGVNALTSNVTGSYNSVYGSYALYNNTAATNTVAVGYSAALGGASYSNQGGSYLGYQSGFNSLTGSDYNTLVGYQSGYDISSGSNNIVLGTEQTTGGGITSGSNNILIGKGVRYGLSQTGSDQLNIGNLIFANGLGSENTLSSGNIGIGSSSPFAKLSVNGNGYFGGNLTATNVTATGTLTVGSLNGPLQANNGVVSATSSVGVLYGGTGLTTAPTYGNILVGNNAGGYTLTATSSLGLGSGTVNSGLQGQVAFYNANGTAVTGTSTLFIGTNGNVGIRNTNAAYPLVVNATSTASVTGISVADVNGQQSISLGLGSSAQGEIGLYQGGNLNTKLTASGVSYL
ncbi:MAG TPA: hypothetical protein VL335_00410, partial [Candidatus Paceibacterota bacterium]|nr:hypothetical protein [Candidatus Paceibacterota bacterium]